MMKLKQINPIKWGMLLVLLFVLCLGLPAWSLESKGGFVAPTEPAGTLTTTDGEPDQVTSPVPADGTTDVPITQQFLEWAEASGATSYDVYFGTSDSPPHLTNTTAVRIGPAAYGSALSYSTTYYWRIDSKNDVGTTTGNVWSFQTETEPTTPPAQVTSPAPADGAINVPHYSLLLWKVEWAATSGATSYDVYFGTSDTSLDQISPTTYTATCYNNLALSYSTTYYWRIDSKNNIGTTEGNVWSFQTEAAPTTPPDQVTSPYPADGETGVFIHQLFLGWAEASGATSYDVYFGTSDSPPYQANPTETNYKPSTLSYSTTYYWRVDSKNNIGTTTGNLWSFQTEAAPTTPPDQVTSPYPADGETGVFITQRLLEWATANGASSYDVYFGTSDSPPYQGNTTGVRYSPGTLSYSTTYYWRVDSKNIVGTTTGNIWSFQTEAAPTTPPNQVTLSDPADGATNIPLYQLLSWTPVSYVTSYDVYFGISDPPPYLANIAATYPRYNPGTLSYNTTYYWRIDSKNSIGTTTGNVWSFQTIGENDPHVEFTVGETSGLLGEKVSLCTHGKVINRPDLPVLTGFSMILTWPNGIFPSPAPVELRDPGYSLYDTIWADGGVVTQWEVNVQSLMIEVRHPGIPMDLLGGKRRFLYTFFNINPDAEPGIVNLTASNVVFYGPDGEIIIPDSIANGAITIEESLKDYPNLLYISDNDHRTFPGSSLQVILWGNQEDILTGYATEIHFDPTWLQIDPASLTIAGTPWEDGDIMVSEVDNELGVIQFEVHQPNGVSPYHRDVSQQFLLFRASIDPFAPPGTVIDLFLRNYDYWPTPDSDAYPLKTKDGTITVLDTHAVFGFAGPGNIDPEIGEPCIHWMKTREIVHVDEPYSLYIQGSWNVELLLYEGSFANFPGIQSIDLGGDVITTVGAGATLEITLIDDIWYFTVTPAEPIPPYLGNVRQPYAPMLRITVLYPTEFEGLNLSLDMLSGYVTWDNGAVPERTIADLIDNTLCVRYQGGSMTITLDKDRYQPGETGIMTVSGEWFMPLVTTFQVVGLFDAEVMQVMTETSGSPIYFPPAFENEFGLTLSSGYDNACTNPFWEGKGYFGLAGVAEPEGGIPGPGSGPLGYIDFQVPETAPAGTYSISIVTMYHASCYIDERGILHSPEVTNCSIEIISEALQMLTVQSVTVPNSPDPGRAITVSPNDNDGQGNGTTDFTRTYYSETVVSLIAPATDNGKYLLKWLRNGEVYAANSYTNGSLQAYCTSVSVTMDRDQTMVTVYALPGDINLDGMVNVLDVVLLVNVAFRGATPSPGVNYDVNHDGTVNVIDVVKVVNVAFKGGSIDPM
ncbi:dockerin type I domain-containing protein [Planctomycetota bacterium]